MRTLETGNILKLLSQFLNSVPGKWQRRRVQSPRTVLATLLILAIERGVTSTRRALLLLRDMYPREGRDRQEPCPAAFSRARRAMGEDSLRVLFKELADAAGDEIDPFRINDHCLIAVDGSQISLPRSRSTLNTFGCYTHARTSYQPQSRLVVAWDVLRRRPIDWVTGTCFESERAVAIHMAPRLPKRSIVLLDRGFQGVAGIKAFSDAGIGCFMRVRGGKTAFLGVQRFIAGKVNDTVIEIASSTSGEPVALRCRAVKATRINARNGTAETVVFLTNLMDQKIWPRSMLLKLYTLRWDIETSFRELKIQDRIENFHSTSADGVRQEIAAYMIARLLAGVLLAQASRRMPTCDFSWDNPRRHVFNNVSLIEAMADTIAACATKVDAAHIALLLEHHFIAIRSAMQRRRPGRTFIRKCKGRYGRWKGTKNHRSQRGRNSQLSLVN